MLDDILLDRPTYNLQCLLLMHDNNYRYESAHKPRERLPMRDYTQRYCHMPSLHVDMIAMQRQHVNLNSYRVFQMNSLKNVLCNTSNSNSILTKPFASSVEYIVFWAVC